MTTYLTTKQVEQMLRPINPTRVRQTQGMSHLEAYDVRAHLNRVLGFGRWSADVLDADQLFETLGDHPKTGKPVVSVGYRARLRLTVHAPDGTLLATYTEVATGDASNFPIAKRADAHDFAVKTAESQALKRAAVNLGDQFGLSLYRNGYTGEIVGKTLVMPEVEAAREGVDDQAPDVQPEAPPVDPEAADSAPEAEQPRSGGARLRAAARPKPATGPQRSAVVEAAASVGLTEPAEVLAAVGQIVGRELAGTGDLTADEAEAVVIDLAARSAA